MPSVTDVPTPRPHVGACMDGPLDAREEKRKLTGGSIAIMCPAWSTWRRHVTVVSRQIALLRAHRLVKKVRGTHPYHLPAKGRVFAEYIIPYMPSPPTGPKNPRVSIALGKDYPKFIPPPYFGLCCRNDASNQTVFSGSQKEPDARRQGTVSTQTSSRDATPGPHGLTMATASISIMKSGPTSRVASGYQSRQLVRKLKATNIHIDIRCSAELRY